MSMFHGIVVYEITDNGKVMVLNGLHTNTGDFIISNEIAKRDITNIDRNDIVGKYRVRYIEVTGQAEKVIECDLEIVVNRDAYEFMWSNREGVIHKGVGIRINNKKVAVSYINVE